MKIERIALLFSIIISGFFIHYFFSRIPLEAPVESAIDLNGALLKIKLAHRTFIPWVVGGIFGLFALGFTYGLYDFEKQLKGEPKLAKVFVLLIFFLGNTAFITATFLAPLYIYKEKQFFNTNSGKYLAISAQGIHVPYSIMHDYTPRMVFNNNPSLHIPWNKISKLSIINSRPLQLSNSTRMYLINIENYGQINVSRNDLFEREVEIVTILSKYLKQRLVVDDELGGKI